MSRERVFEYTIENGTLMCYYDYSPAERQTYDEPGCPAEADVYCIKLNGVDITDIVDPALVKYIEVDIVAEEEGQ